MDHSDIFLLIKLHFLKQVLDEFFSHFWEGCFFMFDVDQLDRVFHIKRLLVEGHIRLDHLATVQTVWNRAF